MVYGHSEILTRETRGLERAGGSENTAAQKRQRHHISGLDFEFGLIVEKLVMYVMGL
jgi:hypothetical protein